MNLSIKEKFANAKDSLKSARSDVYAARKCENINDPIDTYVIDFLAIGWTKLFIKLHIIPNVVTLLAMASGVAGGILIAFGSVSLNVAGAILVILSAVFDACDGQVARLTKHYSRLGRMLDGLSDASVYVSLYVACVIRMWNYDYLIPNANVWHIVIIAAAAWAFVLYVAQCQLPDYFKNLHMYMIDNSHGNELSRAKHVKAELKAAKPFTFEHFSLFCYYNYTHTQERRAPKTQKMLDLIEEKGKSDEVCDAFYAKSRKLVLRTNLMTFNLRTIVLLFTIFLHVEWVGILFVILILEPLRLILLHKYETLSGEISKLI